jgi:hypothetical protein
MPSFLIQPFLFLSARAARSSGWLFDLLIICYTVSIGLGGNLA